MFDRSTVSELSTSLVGGFTANEGKNTVHNLRELVPHPRRNGGSNSMGQERLPCSSCRDSVIQSGVFTAVSSPLPANLDITPQAIDSIRFYSFR